LGGGVNICWGLKGGEDLEFLRTPTREQGPPLACASILNSKLSLSIYLINCMMFALVLRIINSLNPKTISKQ
jgi:hypothetical protein